jgi:hypothetical protein
MTKHIFIACTLLACLNAPALAAPGYSCPIAGNSTGVHNLAWVMPGKLMRSGGVVVGGTHLAEDTPADRPAVLAAYRELKTRYKVGAVVNLREESSEDAAAAKALGIDYLYLPIPDGAAPKPAQVKAFFTFVKQQRDRRHVTLWHCAGGIGRTGVLAGMLRLKAGWSTQDAASEMFKMGLNYDQAVEDLPALNNFAAALGKPQYYPADWRGPRTSPYDYGAIARQLPTIH